MLASAASKRTRLSNKNTVLRFPDSKVRGANMGPIWGRQDPGGPHVGPMNFAIWVIASKNHKHLPIEINVFISHISQNKSDHKSND